MKALSGLILLSCLILSHSAAALTLEQARAQGQVGEMLNGYIAARSDDDATRALVSQINAGREKEYQQVAQQNGLRTADVAAIAGQKLVDRAKSGEYVRGINGQWMKKP